MCPVCSTEEEVWISSGDIIPKNDTLCSKCSSIYPANESIFAILELRDNVTSTSNISHHLPTYYSC